MKSFNIKSVDGQKQEKKGKLRNDPTSVNAFTCMKQSIKQKSHAGKETKKNETNPPGRSSVVGEKDDDTAIQICEGNDNNDERAMFDRGTALSWFGDGIYISTAATSIIANTISIVLAIVRNVKFSRVVTLFVQDGRIGCRGCRYDQGCSRDGVPHRTDPRTQRRRE